MVPIPFRPTSYFDPPHTVKLDSGPGFITAFTLLSCRRREQPASTLESNVQCAMQ